MKRIGIIGLGLVGTALCKAFKAGGFDVSIYNRTSSRTHQTAQDHGLTACESLAELTSQAKTIIIAVTDDAIPLVASRLLDHVQDHLILHTSGTQSIEVFSDFSNYGLFYPLDSFGYSGDHELSNTPIFVDANNSSNNLKVLSLAKSLSHHPFQLEEAKRPILHIGAVMVNNFTNEIIRSAFSLLDENDIPRTALHKLLSTTVKKAIEMGPENSQTGPARRGDLTTIKKHLGRLSDEELKDIYISISNRINPNLKNDL